MTRVSRKKEASKAWNCANCKGTQNSTFRMGQKDDRTNPRIRPVLPASAGGNFMADTDGQMPLHEERWEGDNPIHATPWAKQVRDDINSLKEFDEGDDFLCELNGE